MRPINPNIILASTAPINETTSADPDEMQTFLAETQKIQSDLAEQLQTLQTMTRTVTNSCTPSLCADTSVLNGVADLHTVMLERQS